MDTQSSSVKRNILIFYLSSVSYTLASGLLSEGYVQSFLLRLGLDTMGIGLYGTFSQLSALLGYALFLLWHPRRRETYVRSIFFFGLWTVCLPLSLIGSGRWRFPVFLIYAGTVAYQLGIALKFSCEYSATPMLFPRERYGGISARCGMLGSGLAAAVSATAGSLLSGKDPISPYTVLFALALLALILSALPTRGYTALPALDQAPSPASASPSSPGLSRLLLILLPHLLRGMAAACFFYFVPVSFRSVTLSPLGESLFVTAGVLSTMAACFLFMKLQNRFRTGRVILASNILTAFAAMAACQNASEPGFFALYILYTLSYNVTAYAVPAGVLYSTPSPLLPRVSSLRLLVMSGATCALMTPVAGLLTHLPPLSVMAAGGLLHILSGLLFFAHHTDRLKYSTPSQ